MFGRGAGTTRKDRSVGEHMRPDAGDGGDDVRYRHLQTYHRHQQSQRGVGGAAGASSARDPKQRGAVAPGANDLTQHREELRDYVRDTLGVTQSVADVSVAALTFHERPQNMSKEQVAAFVRQIGSTPPPAAASPGHGDRAAEQQRRLQFERYAANFYRNDVDGSKLMSLSREEMRKDLGVTSPEHQERIVSWLTRLSSSVGPRDAAVRDAPNEFARQPEETRNAIAKTLQQQEDDDFESRIAWRDAALLAKDAALAMLSARVDGLLRREEEWKQAAREYRRGGTPEFPSDDPNYAGAGHAAPRDAGGRRHLGSHVVAGAMSPTRPNDAAPTPRGRGRGDAPESASKSQHLLSGIRSLSGELRQLREETRRRVAAVGGDMADVSEAVHSALKHVSAERELNSRLRLENRALHNQVVDLRGNIRVFLRVRPPTKAELAAGPVAVMCPSNSASLGTGDLVSIRIDSIGMAPQEDEPRRRTFSGVAGAMMSAAAAFGVSSTLNAASPSGRDSRVRENLRYFEFDSVFAPSATQTRVFKEVEELIRSVYEGYNVCIFAYGQTGSGKTHTVIGPDGGQKGIMDDAGVCYRSLASLFRMRDEAKGTIQMNVSVEMREIYNEQIFDLLSQSNEAKMPSWGSGNASGAGDARNRDASAENRRVKLQANLNDDHAVRVEVNTPQDVLDIMSIGAKARVTHATQKNERSSRSHMVLTVYCDIVPLRSARGASSRGDAAEGGRWNPIGARVHTGAGVGVEQERHSMLHLIDLAGSERVKLSGATDQRLKEAQHINKSLSALGDVISALAKKQSHIPYRNSKLTQLLAGSLGGQSKVMMFAHVSPGADSSGESLSTLQFASRTRAVELGRATANVGLQQAELEETKRSLQTMAELSQVSQKELVTENHRLKNQILKLMSDKSDLTSEVDRLRTDIRAIRAERSRRAVAESSVRSPPSVSEYGSGAVTPSASIVNARRGAAGSLSVSPSPQRFRSSYASPAHNVSASKGIEPLATVRERPSTARYSVGARSTASTPDRVGMRYSSATASSAADAGARHRSRSVPRREMSEGSLGGFATSRGTSRMRIAGQAAAIAATARPQSATPQRPTQRRWV